MIIKRQFSLVLHKSLSCGYSLELPAESHIIQFYGELWKIVYYHQIATSPVPLLERV